MKGGITGVTDHFPYLPRAEAALKAYEKAGNEKEIELLAQRDVTMIHNPASNLTLGSGKAPLAAY